MRRPIPPRRYVRGSEGLVRPNLGTHELTRVARAGRAEPHAKEDGPWTTIAWLTSALILGFPPRSGSPALLVQEQRCESWDLVEDKRPFSLAPRCWRDSRLR